MSSRLAALIAPVALFLGTDVAFAQHHGGGHGHGGVHPAGGHPVAVSHGAWNNGMWHNGGWNNAYWHNGHHNYWAVGIGIGLGYGGYGYGGYGYGYPYYGGYYADYPYYGGYAFAPPPIIVASPAVSGYYVSPSVGSPATNGYSTDPSVAPATTVIPAAATTSNSTPAPATATFTVNVPENAQVWFDGKATEPTATRVYTSPALDPDKSTVLSVKTVIDGNLKEMRVPLRPGDKMTLDMRK